MLEITERTIALAFGLAVMMGTFQCDHGKENEAHEKSQSDLEFPCGFHGNE